MAGKKQNTGFLKHWIVKNLLIAFGIVVFLIVGAMIFLNVVTKHNQVLSVPDFTNMTVAEASELAMREGMRVEVADSIFVKTKSLVYESDLNLATFGHATDVWKDENMLSSNRGWYDRGQEIFFFADDVIHRNNNTN